MILQNGDYVSEELKDAVIKNNHMLIDDKSQWFYKKWPGLMINSGRVSRMESRLEEHMRQDKDLYRWAYEQGIIPYPTSSVYGI